MRARLGQAPSRMQLQRPSCLRLVFHRGSLGSALWSGNTSGRWHFFWGGTGTGRKIKQFLRVGFAVLYIVFSFMETIQGEEWGVMERIWGLNFLTTHLQEARNQETLILVSTLLLVHSGTLPHVSVLLLSIVRRSWIGLSCLIGLL